MGKHYLNICVFETSNRHKSDISGCPTYGWTVVIGGELKDSGIFHIAITNNSGRHVKITRNTNMGLLKSCAEDKIYTIHRLVTFHKTKEEPRPKIVEKKIYVITIRNKSGK